MAKARATAAPAPSATRKIYAWSLEQASVLRARRADCLDWDHVPAVE